MIRLEVCECALARPSGRVYMGHEACSLCGHVIVGNVRELRVARREAERAAMGRTRADRKVEGGKKAWQTRRARGSGNGKPPASASGEPSRS